MQSYGAHATQRDRPIWLCKIIRNSAGDQRAAIRLLTSNKVSRVKRLSLPLLLNSSANVLHGIVRRQPKKKNTKESIRQARRDEIPNPFSKHTHFVNTPNAIKRFPNSRMNEEFAMRTTNYCTHTCIPPDWIFQVIYSTHTVQSSMIRNLQSEQSDDSSLFDTRIYSHDNIGKNAETCHHNGRRDEKKTNFNSDFKFQSDWQGIDALCAPFMNLFVIRATGDV